MSVLCSVIRMRSESNRMMYFRFVDFINAESYTFIQINFGCIHVPAEFLLFLSLNNFEICLLHAQMLLHFAVI